jgi:phage-related protein
MEWLTKLIGLDWQALLGLAAVVGVFSLFTAALVPFVETISKIPDGEKINTIAGTFGTLVAAFLALAIGVSTVSKAFTAMDWSAIGQLAVVTGIFDLFMLTLIPFIHALEDVDFETLAGGTALIAGAFTSLGGAIALMAPALVALNWSSLLEGVVLLAAMAGVLWVLQEFVHSLQDLTTEQLMAGLIFLAGGLAAITAAVVALAIAFTALVTTGIGAAAIALLALVLAVVALLVVAMADFVRALGEAGDGIKKILEGVALVVATIGATIVATFLAIGEAISNVVTSIAEGIRTILDGVVEVITAVGEQLCNIVTVIADTITAIVTVVSDNILAIMEVIIDFIEDVIEKVISLAETIVHEVGETIRTIVETVGQVVLSIIQAIMDIVPNLLNSIISFINELGPAIDGFVDSAIQSVTKLVNFVVSAVEYMINLAVDGINGVISGVNSLSQYIGVTIPRVPPVTIQRFAPKYELGTNYVPNDGLAYLHQGEAVIPKKYNQPYAPPTDNSGAIMEMTMEVSRLRELLNQGINVKGEFKQRGSDLVAVVEKGKNRNGNQVLSNPAYAR